MKPTVVFIIDTLQTGGAERSLLVITSHFKKYQPVFVQLFDKKNDLKHEFDLAGIPVINLKLKISFRFNKLAREAVKVVSELNPALIHASLFKSDMVSRKLVNHIKVPLINSLVSNSYSKQRYYSEPLSVKIKLWLLQQWDALTARNVTLFLSNSEAIRFTNARALRINQNYIKVIFRGRSVKPFEGVTMKQIEALRKELNPENKKVFLNISRLINRKGQLDLIRAFGQVCHHRKDCMLLIVGDGPLRDRLYQEVHALSLNSKVILLGNRKDVPLLLKSFDFFVFPSHFEGLPGVLIEAMFAKTPIIASDIPENLECVNEEMALLHPAHDINALSSEMLSALEDVYWPERTQKAFDYAMEHFEISKIAEQYEALYDEVLGMK